MLTLSFPFNIIFDIPVLGTLRGIFCVRGFLDLLFKRLASLEIVLNPVNGTVEAIELGAAK